MPNPTTNGGAKSMASPELGAMPRGSKSKALTCRANQRAPRSYVLQNDSSSGTWKIRQTSIKRVLRAIPLIERITGNLLTFMVSLVSYSRGIHWTQRPIQHRAHSVLPNQRNGVYLRRSAIYVTPGMTKLVPR